MHPNAVTTLHHDNLSLLYQGLLTIIIRIRSGKQGMRNWDEFGKQVRDMLVNIEREAIRIGYPESEVRNTNYAIVAFLDETILDPEDISRGGWPPLQAEMYGDSVAGESFFSQIDALARRRDSPELADVFEIYYLCLLLG